MEDHERLTKILHSLKGADDHAILATMRGFLRAVKGDILDLQIVPVGSSQQAEIDRLRQELEEERAKSKDGGASTSFEDAEAIAAASLQVAEEENAKSRAETERRNAEAKLDNDARIALMLDRMRRRDAASIAECNKRREETDQYVAEQRAKLLREQEQFAQSKSNRRVVPRTITFKPSERK